MDDRSPEKPLFGSALRRPEGRGGGALLSGSGLAANVVTDEEAALRASPRSIASLGTHCMEEVSYD